MLSSTIIAAVIAPLHSKRAPTKAPNYHSIIDGPPSADLSNGFTEQPPQAQCLKQWKSDWTLESGCLDQPALYWWMWPRGSLRRRKQRERRRNLRSLLSLFPSDPVVTLFLFPMENFISKSFAQSMWKTSSHHPFFCNKKSASSAPWVNLKLRPGCFPVIQAWLLHF